MNAWVTLFVLVFYIAAAGAAYMDRWDIAGVLLLMCILFVLMSIADNTRRE